MLCRTPVGARRLVAVGVAVAAAATTAGALAAAPASAAQYATTSITAWKANAAPMGWSASLDRVIYNARGADGLWDAYSANREGGDERCLTCSTPVVASAGTATHRGVGDVDPAGDLMLVEVERGRHFGTIGAVEAEPGKGAYSDVWLERTDGSRAWPLTDIYAPGSDAMGTIWPRFDRTGTKIVWAELYAPAIFNLGAWRLKTADIAWNDGTPSLTDVHTYQPETGRFMEAYGFSPDNRRIIFASDLGMPNWWDAQIYTVAADFTGPAQRLSPADPTPFPFANYNEFAFYVPQGDHIIYGRTAGTRTGGMEYWVMNPDGSGQQQLTDLRQQTGGSYAAVGGLAFDPHDPNRFVAGVASDPAGETQTAMMFALSRDGEQPTAAPAPEPAAPPPPVSAPAQPSPAQPTDTNPSDASPATPEASHTGGTPPADRTPRPGRAAPRIRVAVPPQSVRTLLRSHGFVVHIRTARGGRARVEARTGRTLRGRGARSLRAGATVRIVARASRTAIRASGGRPVRLRITVEDRGRRRVVVSRTLSVTR